jgi:hypothetical protein
LTQTGGHAAIPDHLKVALGGYLAYEKQDGVGTDVYGCVTLQGYLLWVGREPV